jgi:hypothetical protein
VQYPPVLTLVDEERVSPEIAPLLHTAYRLIQEPSPNLVALHKALKELLLFLSSKRGRTNANCAAADSFFLDIDDEWGDGRSQLPEPYQNLLGDIGGCLHDTVSAPEIAENFDSTPEQLLERLEGLDPGAQPA